MPLSADPDKREAQLANLKRGANPAPGGNTRRATHGAHSATLLEPLREQFAGELRAEYPGLDARRLAILADRMARIESARRWLDGRGGVVRSARTGEVWPVVREVERWAQRVEDILRDLERERAQTGRFAAFEAAVAEAGGDE